MGGDSDVQARRETVASRVDFIDLLDEEGPLPPRDVVESLPHSRATVTRALRELRDADLVEKREGKYSPTLPGVMAAEVYHRYETASSAVLSADHLLAPIPAEHALPVEILVDANTILAEGEIPVRAMEAVADRVQQATTVQAFLPTLVNTHLLRVWHRTLIATAGESTAVFDPNLLTVLKGQYPNLLAEMATVDGFSVFETTGLPYGLLLHSTGDETAVTVIVYEDDTAVRGVLTNDAQTAVSWARTRLEELQTDASDVTAELEALSDAVADGVSVPFQEHTDSARPESTEDTPDMAPEGHTLPIDLEAEGFVRLSTEYFDTRNQAPPAVSWRTGFTLAEVSEGYAVDRLDADGRDLVEMLLDRLRDGADQVVVGPPGSGKSTICMDAACEWFARELGPVLYRERGDGARFESAALLEAYLRHAEDHGLVVVEDAIRDDANAIFEVMQSLDADSTVTFLLDARTHEWRTPDAFDIDARRDAYRRTAVERVEVPDLDERECERFVDHFTELVGEDHNLSGGELFELVEGGLGNDANGSPAGDALVAQYYLAKWYDPPVDSDTSVVTALDEAVSWTYQRLTETESRLVPDVAVLIAVLTAAGIPVTAEYLYAVGDDQYAAIDEAITLLEGNLLFEQDQPRVGSPRTYRTRHETWATRFLEAVRATDPERAAQERFGRVVTRLLALADEPSRRQRLQRHLGGRTPHLHQIEADPQRWADELVERIFGIGLTNANLAPLFAETSAETIELPAACSEWIRLQQAYWRGEMNRTHGDLARAEREYRNLRELATTVTLPDGHTVRPIAPEFTSLSAERERDPTRHRTRWHATSATRLGTVARERGEYEAAERHHREALEQFREIDDPGGEALSLKNLGIVAFYQSDYDTAREYYQQSLELAGEHGTSRIEADCLNNLAGIAWKQGSYDEARQYLERSLAISRDLGDQRVEYSILNNLGDLAQAQDDYDQAWDYYEQCLAIFRDFGDRPSEATILTNLGQIAEHQGAYEQSREYLEQSLAIKRELGDRQGEAQTLRDLGSVALAQGAYEQAREQFESSLDLARELGDKQGKAETRTNLGEVAYHRGEDDRATEHLQRCLAIARNIDARSIAARSRTILGAVACRRGEYDLASEHFDAALETFEATGSDFGIARCRLQRGRLALAQDAIGSAREQAQAACKGFEEIGSPHWVGRARHLLGRVEAADEVPDEAREHWQAAIEAFERTDAPQDALTTLEALVELCHELGDNDAAANWYRRAREVRENAPGPTGAIHGDWIERYAPEFEHD